MDGDLTFLAFYKFVLRVMRMDEKASSIRESTSQSEDRDPQDVSTPVRSRSDSGMEEEVSEEDTDSATNASLSVTGQRRCTPADVLSEVFAQSSYPEMEILQAKEALPEMSWEKAFLKALLSHE
jgi:hypothetical protein